MNRIKHVLLALAGLISLSVHAEAPLQQGVLQITPQRSYSIALVCLSSTTKPGKCRVDDTITSEYIPLAMWLRRNGIEGAVDKVTTIFTPSGSVYLSIEVDRK